MVSSGAPFDARGGMAASYANIAALLSERGLRVHSRFGPSGAGRWGRFARQSEYVRVAAAIARVRPRVAVVSSADSALACVMPRRGVRLVAMSNGIEHLARSAADEFGYGQDHFKWGHRHLREPLLELVFRRADASVVLSRGQRQFVIDEWHLEPSSVHVLPQSVEDTFHVDRDLPRVPARVLWIGQWAEFKGTARLVRIVHEVARAHPESSFVLAGVRVDEAVVRATFEADVQDQLVICPVVDRSAMAELIATAHVGLVTSHFEGFGKMILEMMAGGLPVVSSRVGAAEDYITSGVSGVLYDDDAEAIDQLSELLVSSFRSDIGAEARAAVSTCRRDVVGDAWAQLVEELATGTD
jgi:glycosyltransferase involved in cell wall biosynthesis